MRPGKLRPGLLVEREVEEPEVVFQVASFAGPGSDDDSGHGRLFQHVAHGDIGDGDAVAVRDPARGVQDRLEAVPAAGLVDEAPVLHLRPGERFVDRRFGGSQPAIAQQPPGERPVGKQPDPVRAAHLSHGPRGPAVHQRVADLVRDEGDSAPEREIEMDRVEVGDAEVADPLPGPDLQQMEQTVQPAGIGIAPGVELQDVQPVGTDPVE